MNQETKVTISNEIIKILTGKKGYQNQLARKIGISPSQLINMRDQVKWPSVSERLWQKAGSFFQKNSDWITVTTDNFQLIQSLCKDAQENQRMLAVTGKSGLGKTTALKHYARQHSNAFYVLTDYLQKSKEFFRFIAASMNLNADGNARATLQAVIEKVNMMESPLLILDDAGKLNDTNYRNIQLLFDATEGRLGIIISGTQHLESYINKMVFKGKMGFDELKRRIEYWQQLVEPSIEEVEFVCNENNVTDKSAINYLYNSCTEFGTIRSTIVSARRSSKNITAELLIKVRGKSHEA